MEKFNYTKWVTDNKYESLNEQYDGTTNAALTTALGNFGMSYCSCMDPATDPLVPYATQSECESNFDSQGTACVWNVYSSSTSGSTWDQGEYFNWAANFENNLQLFFIKVGFNVQRACIWLTNRFDHQFGKFLTAGNKWKSQLAAKLYHIYYLMLVWGCGSPLQEASQGGGERQWMSYVPAEAKPIIESGVQAFVAEMERLSGQGGGRGNNPPPPPEGEERINLQEQNANLPHYNNYICVNDSNACQWITSGGITSWMDGPFGIGTKITQWHLTKDNGQCDPSNGMKGYPNCTGTCKALNGRRWRIKRKKNPSGAHTGSGNPAGTTYKDMLDYKINFIDGELTIHEC